MREQPFEGGGAGGDGLHGKADEGNLGETGEWEGAVSALLQSTSWIQLCSPVAAPPHQPDPPTIRSHPPRVQSHHGEAAVLHLLDGHVLGVHARGVKGEAEEEARGSGLLPACT